MFFVKLNNMTQERELREIKVEKRGDYYFVILSIGHQSFSLVTYSRNKKDALWHGKMLDIALNRLLSLALEEKVKEVEKMQRKIVQIGVDKEGRRFEIVENSVSLDEVIKILKQ